MVDRYCHKCGKKVENHWDFCPSCGAQVIRPIKYNNSTSTEPSRLPIDDLLNSFKKQFKEIDLFKNLDLDRMEKDFEAFNLRSLSEPNIKRNGFSVSIQTGTGKKPKINIKTFGDVDKNRIEDEIRKNLGININNISKKSTSPKKPQEIVQETKKQKRVIPKITEEPKTNIKRLSEKIIIETELPDVDSEKDIILNILPSSIEIKAIGKKKMYFKIMQIPKGWHLKFKVFTDKILKLEFGP